MDINMSNHLVLNPADMILVLVSTVILVLVAKKYFWNHLKNYVAARQRIISNELEESKRKNAESEKILVEYKAKVTAAQKESVEIIAEAKKRSEVLSNEIVQKGYKDADNILAKAKEQIEKDKADAVKSIQQEIIGVALTTAERFMEENLTEDKHKKMIEDFVGDFEVATWNK